MTGPDAPVFVRFTLDNRYPEPGSQAQPAATPAAPTDQQLLDAALLVLPPRRIPLPAPISLAGLINQQYGLVAENHPSAVNSLSTAIRFWNDDRIAGEVLSPGPDGTARVPLLAPLAMIDDTLSSQVTVTAGRTFETQAVLTQPSGTPLTATSEVRPRFSNYFVRAKARDLDNGQPLQALARSPRGRILAKPIEITLAGQGARPARPAFTPPQDVQWQAAVKNGGREVSLYIFDSGWPSETAMRESTTELLAMAAAARRWYHFPPAAVSTPGSFAEPLDAHVKEVESSIRELRTLPNHVKVIYVPMTHDQGAEPILREFVTLGLAIEHFRSSRTGPPQASEGERAFRAVTTTDVDNALRTISTTTLKGKLISELALFNGLYLVADVNGRVQDAPDTSLPYFVSQSWTTDDREVLFKLPEVSGGFVVAAVGNDDGDNIALKLAFAGWSGERPYVLAVMTFDEQGNLTCRSSTVNLFADNPGAVGYFGQISSPDRCASSYATPRVAWYLAAKESLRIGAVRYHDQWVGQVRARIVGARTQGAPSPQALLFDPVKYFSLP
ncbi:MAG: hypothetical protein ABI665_21385 [Vicinamibacterales bacterium]